MNRSFNKPSPDERNAVERKSFSIDTFALRNDVSRAQVYVELNSGRLEGLKCGSRTLITERAEREWQDALPKRPTAAPIDATAAPRKRGRPPKRRAEALPPVEARSVTAPRRRGRKPIGLAEDYHRPQDRDR
jgi:hypothetical protein